MYANHADMYMILRLAIRTAESSREQLLRIFQRIGYARSAEWARKYSHQKNNRGQDKNGLPGDEDLLAARSCSF